MPKPPERTGGAAKDLRAAETAAWMVQYGPALRSYFARRVGPADAEDMVQEVFLRLHKRNEAREADEPVENIEGYLFRIAKHVLVTRYRSGHRDGLWTPDTLDDFDAADELSPERIIAARQQFARLVVAILNLPPRTRTVFELHRFDRLSFAAIAQRMGISKGAVQTLMQRAIERIVDEMEEGA